MEGCDGEGPGGCEGAGLDDGAAFVGEAGEGLFCWREGLGRQQGVKDGRVGDVEFPTGGVLGRGDGGEYGVDVGFHLEETAPAGDESGGEGFGRGVDEG